MLDVSSGTRSLPGKNAGRPMTHSAPSTGPTAEPRPPITTIDTSSERVVDAEEPRRAARSAARRRAARRRGRRCRPASANARSFTRRRRDGVRRRAVGVVAHGDRGAADAGPAEPGRRSATSDDEHGEARRSSRCAATCRSRPKKSVRGNGTESSEPVGQDRPVVEVLARGERERERAHREQQARARAARRRR